MSVVSDCVKTTADSAWPKSQYVELRPTYMDLSDCFVSKVNMTSDSNVKPTDSYESYGSNDVCQNVKN